MSRLRELRLHGFKTFAEPTRFVFEPGVNAVIGPNGSGKSNMADAVRWVLGEQSNRSLRTRRADDVIFAGSEQRKPLGLAEATLTLDNADRWLPIDYGEVTIGRRAFRSGEGEYLVNGARRRLRDVVELLSHGRLAANELVVVGQGTVDAALSLRPEERRQLFDDAAGVKGLQVRKNEALGRLEAARDNVVRVSDLIGELRPQVRRLAVQAQHQQEHDALGERARALVREAHRRREEALRSVLGEARRRAADGEATLAAARAEAIAHRDRLADAEARYWEAEAAARAAVAEGQATREATIRIEGRLEAHRARREEMASQLADLDAALAEAQDALRMPVPDAAPQQAVLRTEAAGAERQWQAAIVRLAEADGAMLMAEERLATAREADSSRLSAAADRAESLTLATARRVRLEADLAGARDAEAEALAAQRSATAAGEDLARLVADARNRQELAEGSRSAAAATAEQARAIATQLAERIAVLQAEKAALDERSSQDGRTGRRLVDAGWRRLLDVVDAPVDAWSAVEAVLGGDWGETLLWQKGHAAVGLGDARGAVRFLDRRSSPGAAERRAALGAVSGTRTLGEWLRDAAADPGAGHAPDLPALFARVAVAPTLQALLGGWPRLPAGWCAVTAEGDVADGRGMLTLRGRGNPPGGIAAAQRLRRRELVAELQALERTYGSRADEAARAVAAAAAAQRAEAAARGEFDSAERGARQGGAQARIAADRAAMASAEFGRLTTALDAARSAEAEAASAAAASDSAQTADRRSALERGAREARSARQSALAERDAAQRTWLAARDAADQAERAAGTGADRVAAEARRSQLIADASRRREALEAADSRITEMELALVARREADQAASAARASAEARRERLRDELRSGERGIGDTTSRIGELERLTQAAEIEASRLDEALAALGREQLAALEALEPTREDGEPRAELGAELRAELAALDDQAVESEMRRVRRVLTQIGSVNPFAVEEHRELSGRLDEMASQEADLQGAIGSIEDLVSQLDRQISERFETSFAAIAERFDEFVKLLFAGGSANLQLNEGGDGEAPGGIEIVVRPPGKRPQRLAMLSGGERALTGVALLFAMLSVNPVPFCILDEVDAALDEANIGRFADALRHLSETIDFVVITHNRATIEVADTIYGVTMSDAAVSRIVSLRLADVPAAVIA